MSGAVEQPDEHSSDVSDTDEQPDEHSSDLMGTDATRSAALRQAIQPKRSTSSISRYPAQRNATQRSAT
jgi:hypothetical protein